MKLTRKHTVEIPEVIAALRALVESVSAESGPEADKLIKEAGVGLSNDDRRAYAISMATGNMHLLAQEFVRANDDIGPIKTMAAFITGLGFGMGALLKMAVRPADYEKVMARLAKRAVETATEATEEPVGHA